MKVLLAYVRKSIIDDEKTASPARQRSSIERYAAGRGLALEYYDDLDISGRHEANRPGWQALLARLAAPDVAGVIVEAIDRSHRNLREFLAFYDDLLAPRGLALISATQDLNLATADGRAMASVLMTFAEMESRKAGERMAATIAYKQRSEGRHWGRTPFGCERDPDTHHLVPSRLAYLLDPATGQARPDGPAAPGLERRFYHDGLGILYQLYASGEFTLARIAGHLNQAGWRCWTRTREPVEFNRNHVYNAVRLWQTYRGGLSSSRSGKTAARDGGHAPILPVELCDAVGAVRLGQVPRGASRQSSRAWLLSGLLYCGQCGQHLCGQTVREYVYYRHSYSLMGCTQRSIAAPAAEQAVIDLLRGLVDQRDVLTDLIDTLRSAMLQAAEPSGDRAELERQRERRQRLADLYLDKLIDKREYERRYAALNEEIARLEIAIGLPPGLPDLEEALDGLLAGLQRLDQAHPAAIREIVHSLIERIEITDRRISRVVPLPWAAEIFDRLNLCRMLQKFSSMQHPTTILDLIKRPIPPLPAVPP